VTDPDEEYRLLDFFEGVGLLVNRGYLNDKDVWEEFGYWVFPLYVDSRDMLDQEQKDDPTEYTKSRSTVLSLGHRNKIFTIFGGMRLRLCLDHP
jgi:hypothetical protein